MKSAQNLNNQYKTVFHRQNLFTEVILKQVIWGESHFFMESRLKIFDFFFFGEISPSSQMTTSSSILNSVLSLLLRRVPRRFRVNIEKIDFRRFGVFWVVEWYWSRNGASDTVDFIEVMDSSKSTGTSEAAVELSKVIGYLRSNKVNDTAAIASGKNSFRGHFDVMWWAILINN